MLSQAILPKWSNAKDPVIAWPIFVFRCLMYLGTMSRLLFVNARDSIDACRTGDVIRIFGCIKLPGVYRDGYKLFNFVLALLLLGMLTLEPFLYCLTSSSRGTETVGGCTTGWCAAGGVPPEGAHTHTHCSTFPGPEMKC